MNARAEKIHPDEIAFAAVWPEPDARLLGADLPPAPALPLREAMTPRWAAWVAAAAEAKSSPPDYVLAGLLAACGSLIGNARWVSPQAGWAEPPVLWTMAIGNPSSGKSPGLDAVLTPLKRAERASRAAAQAEVTEWRNRAEIAKLVESTWKDSVKAATRAGDEPPARPAAANPGPEPVMPRLAVSDATVEKLGCIVAGQPRGTLLARDELAGWLQGMQRYSSGSDRPFWLEAYGGRAHSVERMGREPVYIDRLTVGVTGGIQPDRLRSLLMKTDDDGLLARFLPIWPDPAPLRRPSAAPDDALLDAAIARFLSLKMPPGEDGEPRPWFVPFSPDAQDLLFDFRRSVKSLEAGAEGLLLSFIGKMPGFAVRLALVLAMLDWAGGDEDEPREITPWHFGRAAHMTDQYLAPMARRAYAEGGTGERAARRLLSLIRETGWKSFTARDVRRMQRSGLSSMPDINAGLAALEEADLIRPADREAGVGRKARRFSVHPLALGRVK